MDTGAFLAKEIAADQNHDQAVSYTDCVSFVLMKREGLRNVFGFDGHFTAAGYRLWPEVCG